MINKHYAHKDEAEFLDAIYAVMKGYGDPALRNKNFRLFKMRYGLEGFAPTTYKALGKLIDRSPTMARNRVCKAMFWYKLYAIKAKRDKECIFDVIAEFNKLTRMERLRVLLHRRYDTDKPTDS